LPARSGHPFHAHRPRSRCCTILQFSVGIPACSTPSPSSSKR
jgi:hypothetical protein